MRFWIYALGSVFLFIFLACPSRKPSERHVPKIPDVANKRGEVTPPTLPVEVRPSGRLGFPPREIHVQWKRPTPARIGPVRDDLLSQCFDIHPGLPIEALWVQENHLKIRLLRLPTPKTRYQYTLSCLPDADTVYPLPEPVSAEFITPPLDAISAVVHRVNAAKLWIRLEPIYPMDTTRTTLLRQIALRTRRQEIPPDTLVVRDSAIFLRFSRPEKPAVKLVIRKGWRTREENFQLEKDLILSLKIPKRNVSIQRVEGTWKSGEPVIVITCALTHESRCKLDPDYVLRTVRMLPRVGNLTATSLSDGSVVLHGDFQPGHLYVLTFPKGFSVEDAALPSEVIRTVQIPEEPVRFRFPIQGMIFPPGFQNGRLPVQVHGSDRFRLRIRWIPPDNLALWARSRRDWWDSWNQYAELIRDTVMEAHPEKGAVWLSLPELVLDSPGVYVLEGELVMPRNRRLSWREREWAQDRATLLISPILLYARTSSREVDVWAIDASQYTPLQGVDVEVRSARNVLIGRCATDANGHCQTSVGRFRPATVLARKGTHVTFLDLLSERMLLSTNWPGGTPPGPFRVALLPERDLYPPGETLHVAVVARNWGTWTGAPLKLRLSLRTPKGRVFRERTLELSGAGWGEAGFDLPATMSAGTYTLQARFGDEVVDQRKIFVEVFRPSRMHLDVDVPPFVVGDVLPVSLRARYLFGRPASELSFHVRCEGRVLSHFSLPDDSRYKVFTGIEFHAPEYRTVPGHLDEEGKANVTCTLPRRGPLLQVRVQAEVSDPTGEATRKTKSTVLMEKPVLIGLYSPIRYASESPVPIALRLWSPEGRPQDRTVTLTIRRTRFEWEYVNFNWRKITWTDTLKVVTLQTVDGHASWTWTPPKTWFWGKYEIVATADDAIPSLLVIHAGWWWEKEQPYLAPERIPLNVPDEVDEGETIPVSLASPYPGKALVTLETQRMEAFRWVDVPAGTTRVDLPGVSGEPVAYVSVFLFHPTSMGVLRKAGMARIQVIPSRLMAPVSLKLPDTLRPGTTAELVIQSDEPVEGAVALVDEGILSLTGFDPPDVVRHILRPYPPQFEGADNLYALMRVSLPGGGEAGGAEALPVVQSQRLFAQWKTFEGKGRLRIPLKVPSFYTGEARLAVHVVSKDRMKTLTRRVPVRSALSWNVVGPDYLYPGDHSQVAVRVWNERDRTQKVKLKFQGPGLRKTRSITLSPRKDTLLRLDFRAPKEPGEAVYTLELAGRATLRDTLRIQVFPRTTFVRKGTLLELREGTHDLTPHVQAFSPAFHRVRVMVAPHPLVGGLQHLAYLVGYPYGCLEQTTSRLVPLVAFYDLLPALDSSFSAVQIRNFAEGGIARLLAFQRYDGSFAFWPGGDQEAPPELQFYTLFLLQEAREAGFSVPRGLAEEAAQRLLGHVDQSSFGAFVLAREGVLRSTYATHLLNLLQDRNQAPEDRLWAAAALYALGNRTLALQHFSTLPPPPWPRKVRAWYESDLRDKGMYLWVREYLYPGHPAQAEDFLDLAQALSRRPSFYYSTQELGWALLALALRLRHVPPPPELDVALTVDGKSWPFVNVQRAMKLARIPEHPTSLRLNVRKGPVYVLVENYGFPTEPERLPTTYAVEVRLRSLDGSEVRKFQAGEWYILEVWAKVPDLAPDAVVDVGLPAGLRAESPRLFNLLVPSLGIPADVHSFAVAYLDVRGHTVRAFGTLRQGKNLFRVPVRAVIPGTYYFPRASVMRMYLPTRQGHAPDGQIVIR